MPKLKSINIWARLRTAMKMEIVLQSKAEQLPEKERPSFYTAEYRRYEKNRKEYIKHLLLEDWPRYRDADWLSAMKFNLVSRRNNPKENTKNPLCASFPYVYRALAGRTVPVWVNDMILEIEDRFSEQHLRYHPFLKKELSCEDDDDQGDDWIEDEIHRQLEKPD